MSKFDLTKPFTSMQAKIEELSRLEKLWHANWMAANKELDQMRKKLRIAIEALEFECDGTCARGINPCNARATIDRLQAQAVTRREGDE